MFKAQEGSDQQLSASKTVAFSGISGQVHSVLPLDGRPSSALNGIQVCFLAPDSASSQSPKRMEASDAMIAELAVELELDTVGSKADECKPSSSLSQAFLATGMPVAFKVRAPLRARPTCCLAMPRAAVNGLDAGCLRERQDRGAGKGLSRSWIDFES